jgi:hypothetical protein
LLESYSKHFNVYLREHIPWDIVIVLIILQLCVGDELPDKVCCECVHQVNTSYNFRLQCETSDVTLRQLLLKREVGYYIYMYIYCVKQFIKVLFLVVANRCGRVQLFGNNSKE